MLEHLDLGGLVAEAVAFLLEQPHLHRDAVVAQGLCHAFGLFRRHHFVLQTLEEQHRTADLVGMQQWRPLLIQSPRCGPFPHQAIDITRFKSVGVFGHGCEITDRIAAGAGPEHLGEAQRRQGGEAAGTATFDGLSIAWAVSEHLAGDLGSRTVFATHYHELNNLAAERDNVANFQVLVEETGEDLVFLHQVQAGGASRSYGIEAARLAGVPKPVVQRARQVLDQLAA